MRRLARMSSGLLVAPWLFVLSACAPPERQLPTAVTVFEGARLITGDGSPPIENSAFIVRNNEFARVGRRGEVTVPAGAARVDLSGKTVMPAKVDLHGHIGYQHDVASGRSADFIVLDANPLENIAYTRKINRVYLRGQEVDRAGLRAKWQAR